MAQAGFTPITIYSSSTATNVPLAANLAQGELAINTADGKLFYEDSSGVVQVIATKAGANGTVTSVAMSVPSFLSVAGSPITSSGTLAVTLSGTALPVLNGGTGVTTSTGTGNVVLSTSPTLVTPILGTPTSGDFSTGTFTWPTFNQNTSGTAAGLSSTLAVGSGGTGAVTLTGLAYGNGTSAFTAATAAQVVAVISTTAVTNATNSTRITNSGGWNVTPTGTDLIFNYNGTNVGKLSSTGNLTVIGNVTAFGTI